MTRLLVDLTDLSCIEFEVLRVKFPLEDGEPTPTLKSVLNTLTISARMLAVVLDDPEQKKKLGMDGLDAPRRHQRKIVEASNSLVGKLLRYDADRFSVLMHLVGRSNRLFREHGEDAAASVFGMLNKPVAVDRASLAATKPSNQKVVDAAENMDRLISELETMEIPSRSQ
jgi:hypothetical protein